MKRTRNTKVTARLLCAVMLSLSIMSAFTNIMTVKAANELVLKLHYHRADQTYDGWDVWLWEAGGAGAGFSFEEENGEMVATKIITPGVVSVGFIVRTADWTKDINKDQFIDISEMLSGTIHIYVESGVEGYTKVYGEDAVTGTKLSKAAYDYEAQTILVNMTGTVNGDTSKAFSVIGTDGNVSVSDVQEGEQFTYTLRLSDALDLTQNYHIVYDGMEYDIVMPNIYSMQDFEAEYTYTGNDLGASWTKEQTTFRVWAPTAEAVKVNLYGSGTAKTDDLLEQLDMTADINGTWIVQKEGDLNGIYYTYEAVLNGTSTEACDPYARTTGVNGQRAMVIDLSSTNPDGWDTDTNPHAGESYTDAIIYELHVRDLSMDDSSGINNKGKFLGVIETGTTNAAGIYTGLDHIKELGITHLHLLPVYDYASVDEANLEKAQFNWGYDPLNYNVPEGSYSTDPFHGEVRVREMKEMVKGLHDNDISVIMDVVYNHVASASEFCFNKLVPGYFTRINEEGVYSNGSGCGNDTASERSMVRKYIVDSVKYWADEYHIDGFRFDLVGLLDTQTINEIVTEVHKTHPDVIFYGEGWTLDTTLTKYGYLLATQTNSSQTPDFAYFNDTLRDGLKGNVFDNYEPGFISGAEGLEQTICDSFLGSAYWCSSPSQTVNYASCHDNMTLMDRITRSAINASRQEKLSMNNLAAAIYMTAEGIPFIHAGEEMLRSKLKADGTFDENSYQSSDAVNSLKWDTLNEVDYQITYDYYKGLIAFRKAHPALRMTTAEEVTANMSIMEGLEANVVGFEIAGGANKDDADGICLIFNANKTETEVTLPDGVWNVYINSEKAGTDILETITDQKAKVAPISALVLVKDASAQTAFAKPAVPDATSNGQLLITAVLTATIAVTAALILKKKK